ncbi:MAG TPA: PEGA domain-containing protein [Kofleriaceae bacterium]|nr:PEGA domain-containing protein [Kofleriaceae bacterium]
MLLVLGGQAWAGSKIAVLGLEVRDNGTGIDPETTKVAKDLTFALRQRAATNAYNVSPAANGDKELIDEKLLANCDSEAAVCMAKIGGDLGADLLLFGKIEKGTGQNGLPVYKVDLKLLYVAGKQVISTSETLAQAEAANVSASASHAKAWYNKLVGATSAGKMVVTANIDRGTVYIDGEVKGTLSSGKLEIASVPEGAHKLVIEPSTKGFQRYTADVTVRTGETLPHAATLAEMKPLATEPTATVTGTTGLASAPSSAETSRRSKIWKPVFYATAGVEAAAIGFTVYEYLHMKSKAKDVTTFRNPPANTVQLTDGDCGTQSFRADKAFDAACTAHTRYTTGLIVSSVLGAAAVGTFIMAFVLDRDSHESSTQAAGGGHKKRREFAVTPIVSPEGGGATLRIDW